MEIKKYKNKYQHDVVDCPFCSYFAYVRPISKTSPDPLRDLKRHITNQAKNEAFNLSLVKLDDVVAQDHLNYYKSHTVLKKPIIKISDKREYDEDLKIK